MEQDSGMLKSLITGKTWRSMNDAEKAAHVLGRGENTAGYNTEAGQAWLDANVGSSQDQINLFVAARDAAAE
jgi:hypothetical protein